MYSVSIGQLESLQKILIDAATYANDIGEQEDSYQFVRSELMRDVVLKELVPDSIRMSRDLGRFRALLQNEGGYRDRRNVIWKSMQALFEKLESGSTAPHAERTSVVLEKFIGEEVQRNWDKALGRANDDPEGAITMARTLLELVCKHILDEKSEGQIDDELPKLYASAARLLNLAPNQHSEQSLKQILQGCTSVVQGLGTLRNKEGDAHGHVKIYRPKARHAELAVNLAGGMALFLVRTLNDD